MEYQLVYEAGWWVVRLKDNYDNTIIASGATIGNVLDDACRTLPTGARLVIPLKLVE